MSAMEKSLRRALEAGDSNDPAFRESIYAASERALERMLTQKGVADDAAHLQRTRLAETINRVEDEFYDRQTAAGAAEDGPAQHDPALSLDPAYADAHAYAARPADAEPAPVEGGGDIGLEPVFGGDRPDGRPVAAMKVSQHGAATGRDAVSEPVRPPARTRGADAVRKATRRANGRMRRLLLLVVAAALAIGLGLYALYSVSGASEGGAASLPGGEWIELFDGGRLDAVTTPNGGRMEALAVDAAPAIRFVPAGPGSGVSVAVGAGVVPAIAGRSVTVELVAGSPAGAATGFRVRCWFERRDLCPNRAFSASRSSEAFLFALDVPADAISAGSFELVPAEGVAGIDLYSMRLRDG